MNTWAVALLIRPIFYFVLYIVVLAPLIWLLYRLFPEGRLMIVLFKVRSGAEATRRDKTVMTLAVVAGYAFLISVGAVAGPFDPPMPPSGVAAPPFPAPTSKSAKP